MSKQPAPVSVVINTKNAASTLQQTLESVRNLAAEIIVADMNSTDETLVLAKKAGARMIASPDLPYVEPARNAAVAKARQPWVLVLDPDEVVPPKLAQAILQLTTDTASEKAVVQCYFLARKNVIFGNWIQHTGWWPDYQPRLFQKGAVVWSEQIHAQPKITGQTEHLPATEDLALEHHNYQTVSQYFEKLNRYTSVAAQEQFAARPKNPVTTTALVRAFFDQLQQRLFLHDGITDSVPGVGLSFLQASYELATRLKVWELQGGAVQQNDQQKTVRSLQHAVSELQYWLADYQVQHNSGPKKWYWQLKRKLRW